MDHQKFFLQSKTIIGVLLMLLTQIAPFIGLSFTEADSNALMQHLDSILFAIGAILAVWGRVRADSALTLSFRSSRTPPQ